jgi:hypothetical protein
VKIEGGLLCSNLNARFLVEPSAHFLETIGQHLLVKKGLINNREIEVL